MDKKYTCYCGLYCENCAVKAKIDPAAKTLYDEMKKAGFDEIIQYIPGGGEFWPFLKDMAENGMCVSCQKGSGSPDCQVRVCAQEKGVEMCALCGDYPCDKFPEFFAVYPMLEQDNELLRDQGFGAWGKMQAERKAAGYTYTDAKSARE